MKRSLVHACVALLGCTSSPNVPVDAGPEPIEVTAQPWVVVTPGSTASIELVVVSSSNAPATLTIGPLPSGLSVPTATWTGQSPITIQLTADADAPITEAITNVTASIDSNVVGTAQITIDVSSLDGALDPTFGTDGFWTLPLGSTSAHPTSITAVANDAWLIAGTTENASAFGVVVARAISNGGLDTTYATNGVLMTPLQGRCTSADVDANGNTIVLADSGQSTAAIVDSTGTLGAVAQTTTGATLIAWDGTTGALAAGNMLVHYDPSLQWASYPLINPTPTALVVSGGSAYLGIQASPNVIQKWSISSPGVYSLDASFGGEEGATGLPTEPVSVSTMTFDSQGRLLVGMVDTMLTIARLLPDGTPDPTFGTSGAVSIDPRQSANITPVGIFPRANGSILVAAYIEPDSSNDTGNNTGVLLARLDDAGNTSGSFGTYGISRTELSAPLAVASAAYDAAQNRLCALSGTAASVPSIVMSCYHVEP